MSTMCFATPDGTLRIFAGCGGSLLYESAVERRLYPYGLAPDRHTGVSVRIGQGPAVDAYAGVEVPEEPFVAAQNRCLKQTNLARSDDSLIQNRPERRRRKRYCSSGFEPNGHTSPM